MLRPLYHGFIDLQRIAVSEKLCLSTENQYLYLGPSTENQHIYEIQVLNLRLICKASIYSLECMIIQV